MRTTISRWRRRAVLLAVTALGAAPVVALAVPPASATTSQDWPTYLQNPARTSSTTDASTGAILWQVYTGDNSQAGAHYNWSSPLIVGNYAYVGIASNCDNPLVQGQLLQVGISGAQQGQIVNTYNFVPNGQVGGGIWTSPSYDSATNTIFVSTGTLAGYTQTQSQAIVALNASTLQYKSSWQLPFANAVLDSDWGTTPTLTT